MKPLTFLLTAVMLSVSVIAQDGRMPQDIPLQKPQLFRDWENRERLIRIGREPFKTRIEPPKTDEPSDANAEQRILALELKVKNLEAEIQAQKALINSLQERLDRLQQQQGKD